MSGTWLDWLEVVIKVSIVGNAVQGVVAYVVLLERRTASFIQDRIGPNRCGPWGLLQPIADGIKLLFKEDIVPGHVNRVFYIGAPAVLLIPALAMLAVMPFGADLTFQMADGPRVVKLQVADVDVGILFMFALGSLGVYGLALGGWASGSKYSLLGAIRSSAQMISYELSLTLSALTVIMIAGTLRLNEIVLGQGAWPWQWNVMGFGEYPFRLLTAVPLSLAAFIFLVSFFAETNRLPFDLPEAESEIVAGYHTEYSSMKFGLFFLAEYANVLTGCALIATIFFGGWMFPGWDSAYMQERPLLLGVISVGVFSLKSLAFLFVMIWVRWTLPRFRFDQLMALGWKRFLPAAMACVVMTAFLRIVAPEPGGAERMSQHSLTSPVSQVVSVGRAADPAPSTPDTQLPARAASRR